MTKLSVDWTHKDLQFTDIRKLNKLYVVTVKDTTDVATTAPTQPLFIKDVIFDERIKSFFLKDAYKITREEILSVKWNMYITQSYYVKINEYGELEKFYHDLNKWYVSYLEIAGSLGSFYSI